MKAAAFTLIALSCLLTGCPAGKPFDPNLKGREAYLCCNFRFNAENRASDANYWYGNGTTLEPGTRVVVVDVTGRSVQIAPPGGPPFFLVQNFGKSISPSEYFGPILLETDPSSAIAATAPDVRSAIREARVIPGMTKQQVLWARGYPPRHRTPDLEAADWTYFISGSALQKVHFIDGKVDSIQLTTSTAP